jgi:hypothetical protein
MDWTGALENLEKNKKYTEHLMRMPLKWRGAVVDVIDTFDIVKEGLLSIGIDDPFVLTEAVRMAIERHDKSAEGDSEP